MSKEILNKWPNLLWISFKYNEKKNVNVLFDCIFKKIKSKLNKTEIDLFFS